MGILAACTNGTLMKGIWARLQGAPMGDLGGRRQGVREAGGTRRAALCTARESRSWPRVALLGGYSWTHFDLSFVPVSSDQITGTVLLSDPPYARLQQYVVIDACPGKLRTSLSRVPVSLTRPCHVVSNSSGLETSTERTDIMNLAYDARAYYMVRGTMTVLPYEQRPETLRSRSGKMLPSTLPEITGFWTR